MFARFSSVSLDTFRCAQRYCAKYSRQTDKRASRSACFEYFARRVKCIEKSERDSFEKYFFADVFLAARVNSISYAAALPFYNACPYTQRIERRYELVMSDDEEKCTIILAVF